MQIETKNQKKWLYDEIVVLADLNKSVTALKDKYKKNKDPLIQQVLYDTQECIALLKKVFKDLQQKKEENKQCL